MSYFSKNDSTPIQAGNLEEILKLLFASGRFSTGAIDFVGGPVFGATTRIVGQYGDIGIAGIDIFGAHATGTNPRATIRLFGMRGTLFNQVGLNNGDYIGGIQWITRGPTGVAQNDAATIAVNVVDASNNLGSTLMRFYITHVAGSISPDSAMELSASVTTDDMIIKLFDMTSGTLKRVSRGAADSGGAGFRVLRIPN